MAQSKDQFSPRFAFVLFEKPQNIDLSAMIQSHAELNPQAPDLVNSKENGGDPDEIKVLNFADGAGNVMIGMTPHRIPTGEAEAAADFSLSRFSAPTSRALNEHGAHAIVILNSWKGSTAFDELLRLSWVVAALAKAAEAKAVYWGNGSVTHPADFFIAGVRNSGRLQQATLLTLWLGISAAREKSGTSFLTLGVREQFGLPDLKLWSPKGQVQEALEYTFNLISYVVGRGAPIAAGETVGRTASERLIVRYEPSPIGGAEPVMCVDLPDNRG